MVVVVPVHGVSVYVFVSLSGASVFRVLVCLMIT